MNEKIDEFDLISSNYFKLPHAFHFKIWIYQINFNGFRTHRDESLQFFDIDYLSLPLLPDQIVSISALQNVTPSKKNKNWSSSQKMVSFSMLIFSKNSIIQSIFPDYDYTLLIISRHTPAKPVPRELNLMARRAKSLDLLPPSFPLSLPRAIFSSEKLLTVSKKKM